jgi:CO/xanthine dehydrogenase Mo-binding subunit
MSSGQVGRSIPRLEACDKVTGRAEYTHNLILPGMLYGKIFRSNVPHGRIKHIDVSAAQAFEGVRGVVTIEDIRTIIPNPYYGPAFHDQPILADGKVRFAGEPVAVVLAEDRRTAEEAVGLITAEYEEMPAVYDEVEAASSATVLVHDELKPAGTFSDLRHLKGQRGTNVALDYHLRHGAVDAAFAAADRVFEHTFRTQAVMHTPLEPFVSIADAANGRLTIYTSSQSPSFVRIEIARLLGWPENRIRVKVPFIGGGFGGKLYIKLEALVTALSLLVERPVKVALTMEEQFFVATRHASTYKIKSGIKNGRITARQCEIWWNGGAYADIGPRVTQKGGYAAPGPYDIDNVELNSRAVYTNRPPASALRGFGAPQTAWAYETHTDLIAEALGVDKVEFRRRNLLRKGRLQATGTVVRDAEIEAVLDRLVERMNWTWPLDRGSGSLRRGRGIAIGFKAIVSPTASVAAVKVNADGSCVLYCGTVDMGQGSDTAMAQIAADVLNLEAESIQVIHSDTDVTPYDMGTLGSRSTFHMGNAVRLAAEDAKQKIAALAAEVGVLPGSNVPLSELFHRKFGMQAGSIIGTGSFIPNFVKPDSETGRSNNITPFWPVGGAGAEVEVDTDTGQYRVTKLVNIVDAGVPINPTLVRQQLSGAAIMQFGFTVSENMLFHEGQLTNNSLAYYKIPGLLDLPGVFINETVAGHQHDGPFGAKGVGESTTIAVSPAIGNAIADAVGVRLLEMPLTAESVFRAMQAAKGNPLPED